MTLDPRLRCINCITRQRVLFYRLEPLCLECFTSQIVPIEPNDSIAIILTSGGKAHKTKGGFV
jgi:hypothetical protein